MAQAVVDKKENKFHPNANNNSGDFLSKVKKNIILFAIGGIGYGIIELLWRRRTHWTMIIAGGLCFIILSRVSERYKDKALIFKAFLCALGITTIELVFGVIFNIILKMNVWDYSKMPLNFLGQICLIYSLLWLVLSCLFLPLADSMNKRFNN